MSGRRTNELKVEGKIGRSHPFYHLPTWVVLVTVVWEYNAPDKSGKPKFKWSVTGEGLLTVAQLFLAAVFFWWTCRPAEHFRRVACTEEFLCRPFFVYMFICFLSFLLNCILLWNMFWYGSSFPSNTQKHNHSCNCLDVRLQNATADFLQKLLFRHERHTEEDRLLEVLMTALSLSFIRFNFLLEKLYNLRWIDVILSLLF